jgi:hypothetical protein
MKKSQFIFIFSFSKKRFASPSLRSFTSIKSVLNFFFHASQQVFGVYHMKKLLWGISKIGTLAPTGIPFSNMPPQDFVLCKHPNTLK